MKRNVLGLGARLTKLGAMSVDEVFERVRYRAAIDAERRLHAAGELAPPNRLRAALVPALTGADWREAVLRSRSANRARIFKSVGEQAEMQRLFESRYQAELAATRAHAADVRARRFEFFGERFTYDDAIPWQSDPLTKAKWPAVYHADVPVHGGNVGYGDVKHVWELSRQQFLIDLAKSWFLTGSRDDVAAMQQLVTSWIAGNPYATGVNWSCALEPAFRVFSWLWAYSLTAPTLDADMHLQWLESFHDHGRFIEQHFELYSSPYNHLIAEGAALYMLGAAFPEFRDAPRWRTAGRAVLEGRLAEQFYADGGSVEQSTFYHHATVGFYLLAALTAEAIGERLARPVWEAIERGLDFSMKLSQPDGTTPTIGGADDGKPIRMEHLPFWDFRPYQAIGAVLFEREDFKTIAGRFQEDALWLLGPEGLRAFDALGTAQPADTSTALPASGYYVMRSGWSHTADYVCFDCGEQAAGMRTDAIPNSMHGHADCLSIVAWLEGRPLLVDSGLFGYNCGGEWEAHFRETAAHNTARIDGRDQARHLGKMAWSHSYRARREGWQASPDEAWVVGSHDGFARGPHAVIHRRAAWLRPDSYLVIYDEFIGTGAHEIEVNFQFAPGDLRLVDGQRAVFEQACMTWTSGHEWTAVHKHGGAGAADGWVARSLGVKQAAPRLTLSCRTDSPRTTLLTVIAGVRHRPARVSTPARAGDEIILVSGDGYTDVIAGTAAKETGIDSDALVTICRLGDAGVTAERIGGSHLAVDPETLRRLSDAHARREPAPQR